MTTDSLAGTISCPFCMSHEFEVKPGKVSCPACLTDFEITDEGECIFFDAHKARLPIKGVFCKKCMLFQYEEGKTCRNCGGRLAGSR
ncbi:MAG: hypothetical protein ACOZF0_05180 [Thermodesulfobacteriota bacterium]